MASVAPAAKQRSSPPLANGEDSTASTTENSSTNSGTPCFHSSPSTAAVLQSATIPKKPIKKDVQEKILLNEIVNGGPTSKVSITNVKKPSSRSNVGRSYSDRRYTSSRTPPVGHRGGNNAANNGTQVRSSTPDINNRWRNSRSSKRSLYASFKFIDDYSPLSTRKNQLAEVRLEERNNNSSQTNLPPQNQQLQKRQPDFQNLYHNRHQAQASSSAAAAGQETQTVSTQQYLRRISIRPSIDSAVQSLDVQCGIGPYRPSCLQKFAEKNWMLFWLCWFCAVQGMLVSGLVPSVLSTIERRFDFRAASLGRIMQWYDIGYALCCIPVSYFGGRHSKPLFIGIGLLIMGCGSFIFSLPHLISTTRARSARPEDIGLCSSNLKSISSLGSENNLHTNLSSSYENCEILRQQHESPLAIIFAGNFGIEILFCFAHLLHGVGATPLFTLGVSYIDENVKPTLSALYIAIFYTFVILGPAAGFLMSGAFLRFHTDFLSTETPLDMFDESDPEWVGAWWIGFQIASILCLFAVFPILSFPKTLPDALDWQRSRTSRATTTNENHPTQSTSVVAKQHQRTASYASNAANDPCTSAPTSSIQQQPMSILMIEGETKRLPLWQRLMVDLRHMPSAVKRLITNPAYMCITLAASVEGLLIAGLSGFMAKYLERQFNVASSRANMLIGCIMVPVAGLGTLASGYIVKRFRLTCPRTLKFCIAMAVFSLVLSPMFLVLCDPAQLSGVQVPYPTDPQRNVTMSGLNAFELKSQCNQHCSCSEDEFLPVCGTVNNQPTSFFTSCFAGCPQPYHRTTKEYQNCTCADGNTVTAGWCESKCSALIGFLILFAPMCLCTFSIGVPALSVVLRCVDYNERSFALGIQWILIRCIGTIPAPAIFAWLFDISCLKRRKTADNECGITMYGTGESDGSCYIYDNKLLADLFLAFALIGQTVTLIFLILASIFYRSNGREDLIVSEAPPQTPALIYGPEEFGVGGVGTPTRIAFETTGKDGTSVKRVS